MTGKIIPAGIGLVVLAGCATPPRAATSTDRVTDLDRRYAAMAAQCEPYGDGGRLVLQTAYRVLREGYAKGHWPAVGLEDLFAEAVQEGAGLFNDPDRRWGRTTAVETKDMLGQTTIGPWQITIDNVRHIYGRPYGITPDWPEEKVYTYCRDHPDVQARMIADYIQEAYTKYGRRGPYGIQRYFWLEAYVRGRIGQGRWDEPVLPTPPDGDWTKLTPEMKADTGFYAKQILLGWRGNPRGLLYWLCVTGDEDAIRAALRTWRDQRRMEWDETTGDAVLTNQPGGFAVRPEDLRHMERFPECHAMVTRLAREVLAEKGR
ncbi:MAG: hypothetical protein JXB13_15040 [Phycisphaerae bacterium]|nr:hypothetical protein [Phycisphaerae bacterium]